MHITHSCNYTNTIYTYYRRLGRPASHLYRPKLPPVPQVYCRGAIHWPFKGTYMYTLICDVCMYILSLYNIMHITHSYTYTNTIYTYCRRFGRPASHLHRRNLPPVPQVYCRGARYWPLTMCYMCLLFYT